MISNLYIGSHPSFICLFDIETFTSAQPIISQPFSFITHKQIQIFTSSKPYDFSSFVHIYHHMISNHYFGSDLSFFCFFPIEIQIFTSAQPIIFLLFSFINISKSKSLLCPNPIISLLFLICIAIYFQIFTLAQTHNFSVYFIYIYLEVQIFTSAHTHDFSGLFLYKHKQIQIYTLSNALKSLLWPRLIVFSAYFLYISIEIQIFTLAKTHDFSTLFLYKYSRLSL